ncbi:hypothetical protein IE53DRAFT_385828 [Violaceomyces palustris]|uniref:Uncharacterized protein n=1 Tax=Violaceomyces palustris TaxID=1673888 RepID=A0ACD0P1J3_9BASI|nr:hypothetical protein IE53DRAFT_385828 [Violaceomyces palustris]
MAKDERAPLKEQSYQMLSLSESQPSPPLAANPDATLTNHNNQPPSPSPPPLPSSAKPPDSPLHQSGQSEAKEDPFDLIGVGPMDSKDEEEEEDDGGGGDQLREVNLAGAPSFDDLFFDLLFASALSVYNETSELGSIHDLAKFMGFFSILWWSWWTQSLFDVRFRSRMTYRDNYVLKILMRIIRIVLLGAWIVYTTMPSEFARKGYSNFSLTYSTTRFCLACDHAVVVLKGWYEDRRGMKSRLKSSSLGKNAMRNPLVTVSSMIKRQGAAIILVVVNLISAILWISARHRDHDGVNGTMLGLWISGVVLEWISQVSVEMFGDFPSLSRTCLPERLTLFALIILGEGVTSLGQAFNNISPGFKDPENYGTPAGGWGSFTLFQVVSSGLIILLQFYAYYSRAKTRIDTPSTVVLFWAYAHVVLHLASAVLVAGLTKTISFLNALQALYQFMDSPEYYLPNATEYDRFNSSIVFDLFQNQTSSATVAYDRGDVPEAAIFSIFSVISATSGAKIPSVEEALALFFAANQTHSVELGTPLKIQLKTFVELKDSFYDPDSVDLFFNRGLFRFNYIFLSCAVFLWMDTLVKSIQKHSEIRQRTVLLSFVSRFFFGAILAIVQIIYIRGQGVPSNAAFNGGLAICASILFVELLAQTFIAFSPVLWRKFGKRSRGVP